MEQLEALRQAIALRQVPSQVRGMRGAALPDGVVLVLRIAADDGDAIAAALEPTGRDAAFLREAAEFFIEQILLAPDADSYRVLGCARDASAAELRRNMALLLRWLHPDVAADRERLGRAARITAAWEALKTADRRADYDRNQAAAPTTPAHVAGRSRRRSRTPAVAHGHLRQMLQRWMHK
jgi:hypothetical protein